MKKLFVLLCAALTLCSTLWPTLTADADPRAQGFRGSSVHRPGVGHGGSTVHRPGVGHHHRFPARHFVPFGAVIAPPIFGYSVPTVLASPPSYYAPPPSYYAPPPPSSSVYSSVIIGAPSGYGGPSYAPAPPPAPTAPPSPRVVEFPGGRYELRGDGIAMAYTWVWIPNPPSAPPAASPAIESGAGDGLPPSRPQIYTWVDKQGVEHWTNRADKVPRP